MKVNIKWIVLLLGVAFIGICIVCIFSVGSPLDKFGFEGCTIGVYNYEGNEILEYLTEEQCKDFVTILKKAELSIFCSSRYLETTGRHKGYKINLTDGNVLDIAAIGQYLVINNAGYKCDIDTLSKLTIFLEEVHKKYYPVSQ